MNIDHIGIIVKSLSNGIKQWTNLFGYEQATKIVVNSRQKVKVVFLKKKNSITIKLLEPIDSSSPIFSFAYKGGGLHHLCFRCKDIDAQIPILKDKGARCIVSPQPGEAFNNNNIAFILAGNNLNIELIDTDQKCGWK